MKLRIRENSIRLRLGESEVAQLAAGRSISESIQFSAVPKTLLTYTVTNSRSATEITAQFRENEITIAVPERVGTEWANSAQVGLSHEQPIEGGANLSILIEKDFRCLEPHAGEDQSDSFPNPAEGRKSCGPL